MNDTKSLDKSEQFKHALHIKEENSNKKQRETSLIPGLGYMTTGQERYRGRRNAVYDSDSDYVKLAKRGGVADLLTFGELSLKPTCAPFRKPECLTPESTLQENKETMQRKLPDYVHYDTIPDMSENGNYNPSSSPFETADRSLCEKEENIGDSGNSKSGTPEIGYRRQRDRNVPSQLQMEAMTLGTETNQQIMQPGIPANPASNKFTRRKEPPVSMQKLLSFGYADDWFSEHKDVKNTKEQKMEEHSVAGKDGVLLEENQPMYRGKRMTGIRGNGQNKATAENDSFFKIFGEHRLKDIPGSVENHMQSEIAFA
ncbi:uncharacterized protein C7orf57 homolog isoform X2 [Heptranchias perlo]|uniref:uncharacterized protein C7orf57 homolog isoform X2 n=1 Tax=Heptranchias perlo TaxID=212740 RepID=UPI003559EF2C